MVSIKKRLALLEQQHQQRQIKDNIGDGLTAFYKDMEDPEKLKAFHFSLYGCYPEDFNNTYPNVRRQAT